MARRFKLIWITPALALIALLAWAYASPIGSSPDDDYHLASIWCANSARTNLCEPGSSSATRVVPPAVHEAPCYAYHPHKSAACQTKLNFSPKPSLETDRGNFDGQYPPVYYAFMNIFASSNVVVSAMVMRIVNIVLFLALTTALFVLLPPLRRQTLLLMWMITTMPLGVFLIASNNPSAWAVIGIGSAWIALLAYFESSGRRKVAFGAIFAVSTLMAAGARGDSALYSVVAIGAVGLLCMRRERRFWLEAILPIVVAIGAFALFLVSGQTTSGVQGFHGSSIASSGVSVSATAAASGTAHPLSGLGLLANNLLNVQTLWSGVFGSSGLGWLDTPMPAVVALGALACFVVAGFIGFGQLGWRKAGVLALLGLVLWVLPVYVLQKSDDVVGAAVQPRYLLPLIVLLGGVLLLVTRGRALTFGRGQLILVVVTLAAVNVVAMHYTIERFVSGFSSSGVSLDTDVGWWWTFPLSPNGVWIIGSLAFAGAMAVLARELFRIQNAPEPVSPATTASPVLASE